MTTDQAERKAKKMYGNKFYLYKGESISSPERRATSTEELRIVREKGQAIQDEINRRLKELDWYQELLSQQRELSKTKSVASAKAMYHRFQVGRSNALYNEILGSGDTWEQAFAEAEKSKR